MNTHVKLSRAFVFGLTLMLSATCSAWYAAHGGGGYYGGGGGYYHGGGGYYHGSSYYGGGGYYGGTVINVPAGGYYGAGYYVAPQCQSVRVCNAVGQCWLQQGC